MRASAPLVAVAAALLLVACTSASDMTGEAGSSGTTGTAGTTGASGDTGTTGAGGTTAAMCGPQSPAPASGGAKFPFPQHRLSASCGYPTNCNDSDVQGAWTTWKTKMLVSASGGMRVQRPENGNDTVSEGIAYGMLMAEVMADKATFDGLWSYARSKRNGNGLMNWHLNADGSVAGNGAATDADEDMAFALVMADKQWGGYTSDASALINAILNKEVSSSNVLLPDDSGNQGTDVNPSYFAPAYYRIFQTVTGQSRWGQVVDQSYAMLTKCANPTTGLVPDWCQQSGTPSSRGMNYSYDACRTPFRIALDACWNNEPRAVSYLANVSAFFANIGGSYISDGYALSGTQTSKYLGVASFIGPAGASAMPGKVDQLLRETYGKVATIGKTGTSSAYNYYNGSWAVLSLMLMTGNFVNLAGL